MDYAPRIDDSAAAAMADQMARLIAQRGQAWGQLGQGLGQNVHDAMIRHAELSRQNIDPSRIPLLQALGSGQSQIPMPQGQQGPPRPVGNALGQHGITPAEQEFVGKWMAQKQAQTMLDARLTGQQNLQQQKDDDRDAREATKRAIPVDDAIKKTYADNGTPLPDGVTHVNKDAYGKVADLVKTKAAATLKPKTSTAGLQEDKFVQTELDKANRSVNPLNAMRGTPLGNAGMMKTRIATARETLEDPHITPQQINAVATDIAGIIQMGAPHEVGIKDQAYQTWYTKAKALTGRILNSPQEAESPATVAKLKDIVNGYDGVYNKLVNTNLDAHKASVKTLLKKYPSFADSYGDLEKQVRGQYPAQSDNESATAPSGWSIVH